MALASVPYQKSENVLSKIKNAMPQMVYEECVIKLIIAINQEK